MVSCASSREEPGRPHDRGTADSHRQQAGATAPHRGVDAGRQAQSESRALRVVVARSAHGDRRQRAARSGHRGHRLAAGRSRSDRRLGGVGSRSCSSAFRIVVAVFPPQLRRAARADEIHAPSYRGDGGERRAVGRAGADLRAARPYEPCVSAVRDRRHDCGDDRVGRRVLACGARPSIFPRLFRLRARTP